jgi:hypothetical protein
MKSDYRRKFKTMTKEQLTSYLDKAKNMLIKSIGYCDTTVLDNEISYINNILSK